MVEQVEEIIKERLNEELQKLSKEVKSEVRYISESIAREICDVIRKGEWLKDIEDDGSGFVNMKGAAEMLGVPNRVIRSMEWEGCFHRIPGHRAAYRVSDIENARKYVNNFMLDSRIREKQQTDIE